MYAPQNAEEKMEKYRFYCELPGDFWEARFGALHVHMAGIPT